MYNLWRSLHLIKGGVIMNNNEKEISEEKNYDVSMFITSIVILISLFGTVLI
mgnify:CR=1 FL=1